jgi:hypothetical protein
VGNHSRKDFSLSKLDKNFVFIFNEFPENAVKTLLNVRGRTKALLPIQVELGR